MPFCRYTKVSLSENMSIWRIFNNGTQLENGFNVKQN